MLDRTTVSAMTWLCWCECLPREPDVHDPLMSPIQSLVRQLEIHGTDYALLFLLTVG